MDDLLRWRQDRLGELVASRYGNNETALGKALGYKNGAFIRQLLSGDRNVTEKTVAKIESLRGLKGWFTQAAPNVELAQELTPHPLTKAPQPGELLPLEVPRTRGEGRPVGSVVIAATGIRASMGSGTDRPETDGAVSEMVVDEGWLRRNCTFTAPENLSLISGVGDSMRPTFEDGDALLVDLGIREVRVDAVYCLALNDELYVKRLQRRPDGTVVMISDNRAYDSYQIQPKRDRLDVLGRVVMTWNARRL